MRNNTGSMVQLLIRRDDRTSACTASSSDTVGQLLARCVPEGAQGEHRFALGGRPLKAARTLGESGVRSGMTLQLLPRVRGGTGPGAAPSWGTGPGVVLPVFEAFQSARLDFASELAKLAAPYEATHSGAGIQGMTYEVDAPEKVLATLEGVDVLAPQIVGLATDLAPQVRECAMIAIGRMCTLSDKLHGKLAQPVLITETIKTIQAAASPATLKASMFLLQSTVQNSPDAARLAVENNALAALAERLEDADAATKMQAAWALGSIAAHDAALATLVVDCGAVPSLLLCVKEPSLPLRRVALSALGSIGKHDQQLAETMQKDGAVTAAQALMTHRDPLLRRHACRLLALCCQHHESSAAWFSNDQQKQLVFGLTGADAETHQFAAALVQALARASRTMAAALHELGAVPLLAAALSEHASRPGTPGSPVSAASALGHICDASPEAAPVAIEHGVVLSIAAMLGVNGPHQQQPSHVCAVLSATLGALANVDAKNTDAMCRCGALQAMLTSTLLHRRPPQSAALAVARNGLARVLGKCEQESYPVLVWMAESLPYPSGEAPERLSPTAGMGDDGGGDGGSMDGGAHGEATVLAALFRGLATALEAKGSGEHRLDFVRRGALARAQQADKGPPALRDALKILNGVFPGQMVQAAKDPDYEKKLLATLAPPKTKTKAKA